MKQHKPSEKSALLTSLREWRNNNTSDWWERNPTFNSENQEILFLHLCPVNIVIFIGQQGCGKLTLVYPPSEVTPQSSFHACWISAEEDWRHYHQLGTWQKESRGVDVKVLRAKEKGCRGWERSARSEWTDQWGSQCYRALNRWHRNGMGIIRCAHSFKKKSMCVFSILYVLQARRAAEEAVIQKILESSQGDIRGIAGFHQFWCLLQGDISLTQNNLYYAMFHFP